jgi:hypothetical protein
MRMKEEVRLNPLQAFIDCMLLLHALWTERGKAIASCIVADEDGIGSCADTSLASDRGLVGDPGEGDLEAEFVKV